MRADFDRIALLTEQYARYGWNHNDHYHGYLLKHLPADCAHALEIGCGTGAFSRCLAARSKRVLALDLSPQMARIARQRSHRYPNIDYLVADALEWEFPAGRFDCVASIATLHHMPLEAMLSKLRAALRPNGVLVVLDVYRPRGPVDVLASVLAVPVNLALRIIHGQMRVPREVRNAWAEHGRHDNYLTLRQVRRISARVLPGARVKRHLLWRYSIVWKKPAPSG